jgi:hypothetical protein
VEPETPSKFVAGLITRQAFLNFSRGYEAAEGTGGAQIAGTGSRSLAQSSKVRLIGRDFKVDDRVFAEFRASLSAQKLRYTDEELMANKEALSRLILEEVVRQVFGEGEARKRTLAFDPQVKKALELAPRAERLLSDPQKYVAQREAEKRLASLAR